MSDADPRLDPSLGDETASSATPDRGVSPISGRIGGSANKIIVVAALVIGGGAFLAATWGGGRNEPRPMETQARQVVPFEPAARPDATPMLATESIDPNAPLLGSAPDGTVPAIDPGASAGAAGLRAPVQKSTTEAAG